MEWFDVFYGWFVCLSSCPLISSHSISAFSLEDRAGAALCLTQINCSTLVSRLGRHKKREREQDCAFVHVDLLIQNIKDFIICLQVITP